MQKLAALTLIIVPCSMCIGIAGYTAIHSMSPWIWGSFLAVGFCLMPRNINIGGEKE